MPGVRIRAADTALAGKVVELEHHRTLSNGQPKVYRLRLDDTAAVIVSPVVWDRLQQAMAVLPACPRFYPVDEVRRPPTQTLGGKADTADVVRYQLAANRLVNLGERTVPRITLR